MHLASKVLKMRNTGGGCAGFLSGQLKDRVQFAAGQTAMKHKSRKQCMLCIFLIKRNVGEKTYD